MACRRHARAASDQGAQSAPRIDPHHRHQNNMNLFPNTPDTAKRPAALSARAAGLFCCILPALPTFRSQTFLTLNSGRKSRFFSNIRLTMSLIS